MDESAPLNHFGQVGALDHLQSAPLDPLLVGAPWQRRRPPPWAAPLWTLHDGRDHWSYGATFMSGSFSPHALWHYVASSTYKRGSFCIYTQLHTCTCTLLDALMPLAHSCLTPSAPLASSALCIFHMSCVQSCERLGQAPCIEDILSSGVFAYLCLV